MTELKPYPAYKDSGVEWIGMIPKDWKITKIKYQSKINELTLSENTKGNKIIKYIDIGSVDSTGDVLLKEKMKFENAPSRARRILRKNDIIISTVRTYLRAIATIEIEENNLICSTGFAVLTPKKDINASFLSYLLHSSIYIDQIVSRSVGVSYPAINASQIGDLECLTPNQLSQEKIALFLNQKTSQIDSLIAHKERLIKLLEEKRQAVITETVTKGLDPDVKMKDSGIEWIGEIPEHWELTKVKHVTDYVGSGKTPRGGSEVYSNEGVIFLRSQNVHNDGLRLDDVVYINNKIDEDMRSTRVYPGDVLLNITGASIGRTCKVPKDLIKANVNQHVCIVRPNSENIVPDMFAKVMSSQIIKNQIFMQQDGSSREGLNFKQIRNLFFPLSNSEKEQSYIGKYIEKTNKIINELILKIKQQISKLKEYRESLIYEAVTGKIDLRDYEPEHTEI